MPPGTPQHNGVSERRSCTLLDMVRSMMSLTDLPLSFWGYALETTAFTLNRAPSKSVETTPYELWFGKICAKNGSFLEKKFLSKEVSGRKVELDEVIVPTLNLEGSSSEKSVSTMPTPTGEEANDKDHETSNQVAT